MSAILIHVIDIAAPIFIAWCLCKSWVLIWKARPKQIENVDLKKWLLEASVDDMAAHLENGGSFKTTPDQLQRSRETTAGLERVAKALADGSRQMGINLDALSDTHASIRKALEGRKKSEMCLRCGHGILPGHMDVHYGKVHPENSSRELEKSTTGDRWIGYYNMLKHGGSLKIFDIPITMDVLDANYPSAQDVYDWAAEQARNVPQSECDDVHAAHRIFVANGWHWDDDYQWWKSPDGKTWSVIHVQVNCAMPGGLPPIQPAPGVVLRY